MLNSFYNHTLYLNQKSNDVFYELHAFAFDFREMPSVFSGVMIHAQALFTARAISLIMRHLFDSPHKFHLLGHSMGGLINYYASI